MNESVERSGWHVVPEKQEATVIIPRDIKFIVNALGRLRIQNAWTERLPLQMIIRFDFIMSGFDWWYFFSFHDTLK